MSDKYQPKNEYGLTSIVKSLYDAMNKTPSLQDIVHAAQKDLDDNKNWIASCIEELGFNADARGSNPMIVRLNKDYVAVVSPAPKNGIPQVFFRKLVEVKPHCNPL